jgi:serine/threonine-protein kinase HipA
MGSNVSQAGGCSGAPVNTMKDAFDTGLPKRIQAAGERAYAIKRFDRAPNGEQIRIEDFAQVFEVYPDRKYERASYRNIAEVLWAETGETDIVEFLRRLVFNVLIGNANMHLKNWSLIYLDRRRAALAPAYDFVSTVAYLPDDSLTLSLVDSKQFSSINMGQFERFAAKARLPTKLTLDTVQQTVARFADVWSKLESYFVDPQIWKAFDRHLLSLRLEPGRRTT